MSLDPTRTEGSTRAGVALGGRATGTKVFAEPAGYETLLLAASP